MAQEEGPGKGGLAGVNDCNRGTSVSVEVGQGVNLLTEGLTEKTRSQRSQGNLHDVKRRMFRRSARNCVIT